MKKHTGVLLFAVALYCSDSLLLTTWGHTEAQGASTRKVTKDIMAVPPSQDAQPPKQNLNPLKLSTTQKSEIQNKLGKVLKLKKPGLSPYQETIFEKSNCLQLELQCLDLLKMCPPSPAVGWYEDFPFGDLQDCVTKKKGDDTCSKYTATKPLVCQAGYEYALPKNVSLCPSVTGDLKFDMNCADGVTAVYSVCQEKPLNSFSLPPGAKPPISYCVGGEASTWNPGILDIFVKSTGDGCCFMPSDSGYCPYSFSFGSDGALIVQCIDIDMDSNGQPDHEFCLNGSVEGDQCKADITLKKL